MEDNVNITEFKHIYDTTKKGYMEYSWIIYTIGLSVIVGSIFGIKGGSVALILTFVLFYATGRAHNHINAKS